MRNGTLNKTKAFDGPFRLPRKAYHQRIAHRSSHIARKNGILGDDADWVDYEMIMSTDPDQIAMTPGYLQTEWTENGRRYFHYKMDQPIHNLFAFVSGRYAVMKELWNGIDLEILYLLNSLINYIDLYLSY